MAKRVTKEEKGLMTKPNRLYILWHPHRINTILKKGYTSGDHLKKEYRSLTHAKLAGIRAKIGFRKMLTFVSQKWSPYQPLVDSFRTNSIEAAQRIISKRSTSKMTSAFYIDDNLNKIKITI